MNAKLQSRYRQSLLIAVLAGLLLLAACVPVEPEVTPPTGTAVPATAEPTQTPVSPTPVPDTASATEQPTPGPGTSISYGPLALVVPAGVASGASGQEYPAVDGEDAAGWQKTPGHWQVMLGDYYVLQDTFHQPQIYVYPAQAYAELVPPAFEGLRRLNNILGSPGESISADQLPGVPFFNAGQVMAAQIQTLSFQNGRGVRFLTEYSQYYAPVNNHELIYQFQGVTADGAYTIIAILPVTAPVLAESSDPAAVLPPDGIAYPDINDPDADWEGYYTAVTGLLNATPPDAFTPDLAELDSLIQSMEIIP